VIDLRKYIRDIPDFPKPGILFRDVTPLLQDAAALRAAVDAIAAPFQGESIDFVVGIDARGFVTGAPVALALNAGFVMVRKPGKLPGPTLKASYDLEYGSDQLEMRADALPSGARVLLVDDLIATGGTAAASLALVREAGADVVGCAFLIELIGLHGRKALDVDRVHAVLGYD
jgi:adenine phosphoribosyltransferase